MRTLKIWKILGTICLAAVLAMSFAACGSSAEVVDPPEDYSDEYDTEGEYDTGEGYEEEEPIAESPFTKLELGKYNAHTLGATYAEMCEWYNREADVYCFMEEDYCYATYFGNNRNCYCEMRKARDHTECTMEPEDYCFGLSGWFSRVFEVERDGPITAGDIIDFLDARNVTTMDVTDELEAPTNLGTENLLCMDVDIETAFGTKTLRLEIEANDEESSVTDDTWIRLYELNH